MKWYDLQDLLPPVYASIASMYASAITENDELKLLDAESLDVYKNFFIQTCDEDTIKYWENILGIEPGEGETLEYRRSVVISYLSTKQKITIGFVRKTMGDIFGDGHYEIKYSDISNTILEITIFDSTIDRVKSFVKWFNKVCPAHVQWGISRKDHADFGVDCYVGILNEKTSVVDLIN